MQISIVILLFSDQMSGRGESFQGGKLPPPAPPVEENQPKIKKDPKIVTVRNTKNLNNDTLIKDLNELPFELRRVSADNPLVKL